MSDVAPKFSVAETEVPMATGVLSTHLHRQAYHGGFLRSVECDPNQTGDTGVILAHMSGGVVIRLTVTLERIDPDPMIEKELEIEIRRMIENDRLHTGAGLCSLCDVFVGLAAAGVVKPPPDKSEAWLASHCWICHRSAQEVQADPKGRINRGNKA